MCPAEMKDQRSQPNTIGLLRALPNLGDGLDPAAAEWLARRLIVPTVTLEPGPWDWRAHPRPAFGVLVLDGLIAHRVQLGGVAGTDLVGRGHLLAPWSSEPKVSQLVDEQEVRALAPTRLAILDREFAAAVARVPALAAAALAVTIDYAAMFACFTAIRAQRHMEERMITLLWHMAERWGRMTPGGVRLELPGLTQSVLAEAAAASRQSVSKALTALKQLGLIAEESRSTWLLRVDPAEARLRLAKSRAGGGGRRSAGSRFSRGSG